MNPRFLLRFETGERRGEEVPIAGARVKIGRRSVNDVRVVDPSVSGEHAELLLQGDEVELADCGSTNGVRVGGRRVSRCELRPGDVFALGNVKLRLLDAEAAGGAEDAPFIEDFGADEPVAPRAVPARAAPPPARAQAEAPTPVPMSELDISHTAVIGAEEIGEGVGTIRAEVVQQAGRRSVAGIAVVAVLLVGGGFVAWRQWGAADGAAGRAGEPPPVIAGNLLTGGSFEGEDGGVGWEPDGEPTVPFGADELWRHTGLFGLGVDLRGGEWAAVRSPEVRVRPRRALIARAWLEVEGEAGARLGVRLTSGADRGTPLELWSAPIRATSGFEEHEFAVDVPVGYDRAVLLVDAGVAEAGAGGEDDRYGLASLDDAALVQEDGERGHGVAFEEFRLLPVGEPAARVLLIHVDRVLFDGSLGGGGRASVYGSAGAGALALRGAENGATLELTGVPRGASLGLRVDPELAASGVATTGPSGYRAHTLSFEEPQARSILLGSGIDLVRLGFAAPTSVRGRPVDGGFELEVAVDGAATVDVQLSFLRDRGEAQQLARGAREQEAEGRLGAALNTWAELLNTYPFEAALVREADETVARLLEGGLGEVQSLRREMERARFFGLSELTRRYAQRVDALAERYAETEVALAALALAEEIGHDLAALERERVARRAERLAVIADLLAADEAPGLAQRVREELAREEDDG